MIAEALRHGGDASSIGDFAKLGVVTVSDRASSGEYTDISGPYILQFFQDSILSQWTAEYRLVPDEQDQIETVLKSLIDEENCCLVVTTGGTGPSPRDVTPEATQAVCDRLIPGFGEQMRSISLKYVPTAILSRQTAGSRGKSLIINLPGKPKSIRETLDEIFKAVPYCVDLLGGPYIETNPSVVDAFRPPNERRQS
eukprot:g9058.t1